MSKDIRASAGTTTGLLLAEAGLEDLVAHPAFTQALVQHRPQLVKSLTLAELEQHPNFKASLATQIESGLTARLATLKAEDLKDLPAIKAIVEQQVQAAVVSSDGARQFLAMVKTAAGAPMGVQDPLETPIMATKKIEGSVHDDSVTLDGATRTIMAADKSGALSYGDAMIQAAEQMNYRKGGK